MKRTHSVTNSLRILSLSAAAIVLAPTLLAQPAQPPPTPQAPPTPVAQPPALSAPPVVAPPPVAVVPTPGVAVTVGIPDSYAWDGYEYVGVVGDQYYYLGPGNVWMIMNADRLGRFHDWERIHHDWRDHAIRNEHYRRDALGHDHPWDGHEIDHGHDHDIDHGHDHDGH